MMPNPDLDNLLRDVRPRKRGIASGKLKGASSRKRHRELWHVPDWIRPGERLAVPLPPKPERLPGYRFEDLVAAFGLGVFLTALVFIVIGLVGRSRTEFPPSESLVADENGIIHHPHYGDYPAVVPFAQGMTIMPGQAAVLGAP